MRRSLTMFPGGMPGIVLVFLLTLFVCDGAEAGAVTDRLAAKLRTTEAGRTVPVIVSFSPGVDPSSIRQRVSTTGELIRSLQQTLAGRHDRLRGRMGPDWTTGKVQLLWINQTIALDAARGLVERLSRDPEVETIELDAEDFTAAPAPPLAGTRPDATSSPAASVLPWNITVTGVDSVWAWYGINGYGVTIGQLDTGIDTSHPALRNKLRSGDAWRDFIFAQGTPYDNVGHGTFGSGILVGANGNNGTGAGVGIGIAYRARLVVGKMLDVGASTISQVTTAMQWMLDPDNDPNSDDFPRVVNNSWYSGTRGSTYAYAAASAWRAAGIVPVFCAGNEGPASGSTRSPGDYNNCISVGGTDVNDDRLDNTSVGPSPADTNYFPADGRKPDLSAPGEYVTSSQKGGGYGPSSGTSWSAPHVTGVVALMLQANPFLDYDRVLAILKSSAADLGAAGYDAVFGYGRISAMGAVRRALASRVRVTADSALSTSEGGQSVRFDLVLDVAPADTVRIDIAVDDTTEASVSPGAVYFTPSDWQLPRHVTVTGKDDVEHDGDVAYHVTMAASSPDRLYDGILPDPLPATNRDDENGIGVAFSVGWNLVSLPASVTNPSRATLFPSSASQAYAYDSGYVAEESLRRGAGYWLKFGGAGSSWLVGDTVTADTVAVVPGWNLVGSISLPVAAGDVASEPAGIVASRFYGYETGYSAADTIVPGRGYWVKVASAGVLILRGASP